MLPYRLCLDVGDWSGDGYGKHETIYFLSNLSEDLVIEGYLRFTHRCQWRLHGHDQFTLCNEYEQSNIGASVISDLRQLGVNFDIVIGADNCNLNDDGSFDMCSDHIVRLFLEMTKVSFPHFEYEVEELRPLNLHDKNHIGTIGYGVFP